MVKIKIVRFIIWKQIGFENLSKTPHRIYVDIFRKKNDESENDLNACKNLCEGVFDVKKIRPVWDSGSCSPH